MRYVLGMMILAFAGCGFLLLVRFARELAQWIAACRRMLRAEGEVVEIVQKEAPIMHGEFGHGLLTCSSRSSASCALQECQFGSRPQGSGGGPVVSPTALDHSGNTNDPGGVVGASASAALWCGKRAA